MLVQSGVCPFCLRWSAAGVEWLMWIPACAEWLTAMPPFFCLLSRYKGSKDLSLMNQIHICHLELFTSASLKQTQEAPVSLPLLGLHTFLLKINFKNSLVLFLPEGCTVTVPGRCWFSDMGTKACRKWGLKSVTSQERGWPLQLNVDLAQDLGPAVPRGNAIVHSRCFVVKWF